MFPDSNPRHKKLTRYADLQLRNKVILYSFFRAKTIVKTKGIQLSLEKRKKMQEEIKLAKQLTRNTLDERKKQKEENRQRRLENLKKRKENQKKAEIVQVVSNSKCLLCKIYLIF